MQFKTLYKGDWVSLITPEDYPYECLHEGSNVIILPIKDGKVGIRSEFCPPYFVKEDTPRNYFTVISGMKEAGEDCKDAALRELREESGVVVKAATLYRMYENRAFVKNTDMRSYLVVMVVKEYTTEQPEGDGTSNEQKSKTIWVTLEELQEVLKKDNTDCLLYFCSFIIKNVFETLNKTAWQEPRAPIMYNQDDIDYWKQYEDTIAGESDWLYTVEDVIDNAKEYLAVFTEQHYNQKARYKDVSETDKKRLFSYIIPLALDFLHKEGKINLFTLEAMVMQNLT